MAKIEEAKKIEIEKETAIKDVMLKNAEVKRVTLEKEELQLRISEMMDATKSQAQEELAKSNMEIAEQKKQLHETNNLLMNKSPTDQLTSDYNPEQMARPVNLKESIESKISCCWIKMEMNIDIGPL